ncbi:hypothetical protein FO519_010224 [Halicephalobus sp. NKZ332]|nr:hypothetical protein FO519_010224 [Halicephalobus sp. NKZ332]
MIIPNDDGNMQKIQKSSIKEPVPDFTEISKNPITNEFPLHKAQKCTTIPSIHLPDVETSALKTNRSREKIDEKEAMLIEEKSTTPNNSVVEAVRNIDSGNNDFREITPEVEVPPPEFLSRPPIRINLSLVPNQLASNHLMMNDFDDNEEEESIPQPSESKITQINMMRDIGITVDKRIEEIRSHMDFHRGDIEKNPLTIIDVIIVKINVTKNIIMLVTLKNGGIGTLPMTTEEVIVLKANQCPIVE